MCDYWAPVRQTLSSFFDFFLLVLSRNLIVRSPFVSLRCVERTGVVTLTCVSVVSVTWCPGYLTSVCLSSL